VTEVIEEKPVGAFVRRPKGDLWWRGPLHFAIHIFIGTAIFGVIALAAVGLALLTAWVKTLSYDGQPVASSLLVGGLLVGEYAVFGVDLVLFLIFLARTAWRMAKEL
jgi:hypothetical protein